MHLEPSWSCRKRCAGSASARRAGDPAAPARRGFRAGGRHKRGSESRREDESVVPELDASCSCGGDPHDDLENERQGVSYEVLDVRGDVGRPGRAHAVRVQGCCRGPPRATSNSAPMSLAQRSRLVSVALLSRAAASARAPIWPSWSLLASAQHRASSTQTSTLPPPHSPPCPLAPHFTLTLLFAAAAQQQQQQQQQRRSGHLGPCSRAFSTETALRRTPFPYYVEAFSPPFRWGFR